MVDGPENVAVVSSQGDHFRRPVGGQRRRQVIRVHGDDLADRRQACRFGRDGVDAIAEYRDIDLRSNGLGAANALGGCQVQVLAVVFSNDQYSAHISPLFFSSCTSCAASSTMMPLAR